MSRFAFPDLRTRSETLELMDDLSIGGEELSQALSQLRTINRLLGAARPALDGVRHFWAEAGRPAQLSVLDVGAGTGDQNRALLDWAHKSRVDLRITLIDLHEETCEAARVYYRDTPAISVRQADLFQLAAGSTDVITASQVLHHIPAVKVPDALRAMRHAARLGVVINDLHRHVIPLVFIKAATQLLSRNRMIRNDAPLSVRRGFVAEDFIRLQAEPGLSSLTYHWKSLFRWMVLVRGEATVQTKTNGTGNTHPHPHA